MIEKRCVICDSTYLTEIDRGDNKTCSVACRSKLHRERRKATLEQKARLLSKDEQSMMLWLKKNVPDAAHSLEKIKAIHGRKAFELASEALRQFAQFNQRK
ncbi:MAG: hypothetical protein Phog2KO_26400 [Phototrophicaceae bacterium]